MDLIKDEIIDCFADKNYNKVIKLYESNSIAVYNDFAIIGFIAFSYQHLQQFSNAIKIVESNLDVADLQELSQDLDLIFLVAINSCVELNLSKKGLVFAIKYLELEGDNQELIRAYRELKKRVISENLSKLSKSVILVFSSFYIGHLILEYVFNYKVLSNISSFVLAALFFLFLLIYYYTDFFNRILDKHYTPKNHKT